MCAKAVKLDAQGGGYGVVHFICERYFDSDVIEVCLNAMSMVFYLSSKIFSKNQPKTILTRRKLN